MAELITYFHARGIFDWLLLVTNGLLATSIFAVLLFARERTYRMHRLTWLERLIRFALVAAYGVLAARVWMGWYYTPVEPTHVAVNGMVLAYVLLAHGDISVMLGALRLVSETRRQTLEQRKSESEDYGKLSNRQASD